MVLEAVSFSVCSVVVVWNAVCTFGHPKDKRADNNDMQVLLLYTIWKNFAILERGDSLVPSIFDFAGIEYCRLVHRNVHLPQCELVGRSVVEWWSSWP